jgi:hypothetical protein
MGNETCRIDSFNSTDQNLLLTCPVANTGVLDVVVPAIVTLAGTTFVKSILDSSVSYTYSVLINSASFLGEQVNALFHSKTTPPVVEVTSPIKFVGPPIRLPHKRELTDKYLILGFTLQSNGDDYLPLGWHHEVYYDGGICSIHSVYNEIGKVVFNWSHYYRDSRDTFVTFQNYWILKGLSYDWSNETPYALMYVSTAKPSKKHLIHGFFSSEAYAKAALAQFTIQEGEHFIVTKFDSSPPHIFVSGLTQKDWRDLWLVKFE